jgi:hypothetical protein
MILAATALCWVSAAAVAAGASVATATSGQPDPSASSVEIRGSGSTLWESGIIALVSACISSFITSRILLARTTDLAVLITELKKQGEAHAGEITKLALDLATEDRNRLACELRCHRTFSTHVEVAHVISENSAQAENMSSKLGVVHSRVDDVVRAVGELSGYLRARDRVPTIPAIPGEGNEKHGR